MINKGKRGVEIINKIMQYFLKDISHQIERAHRVPKITDENKHISEDCVCDKERLYCKASFLELL